MFVRLAAVLAIAATFWPLDFEPLRGRRGLLLGVGAIYLLVLLQLVALPPGLWASLPGHAVYAEIARATGSTGWRPLSLTPDLTLNALLALLPPTAAGLCALYLDFRGRIRLAEGVVAAACLSGVLGLVQLAMGGAGLHIYRETSLDSAVGFFANRNHQAAFLACALPLVGALAGVRLREGVGGRFVRLGALGAAAFLLLGIILTQSRMGLVLGLVGTFGALASYRASGHRLAPANARLALLVSVAVVLIGLVAAVVTSGVLGRFVTEGPSGETRLATLAPIFTTARAFMPWGAGFGAFDSVYRHFEPNALLSTIYMNEAHNEPLQLAIEGGLPALALLGFFGWWWATTVVLAVRARLPAERRAMSFAAVTITLILMLSSLVDYPLRTPLLGALFAVACVELAATARRASRTAPSRRGSARSWSGVADAGASL